MLGHSYGGLVITGVVSSMPERIQQLIYLDALVPENNDSLMDLVGSQTAEFFIAQANEHGSGWSIPPLAIDDDFFSDSEDVHWCRTNMTSQTIASFLQPLQFFRTSR